ncbi:hypothetical protein Ndes2437B_g07062 [Nannochloris sp. 'desiccata']
MMTTKALQVPLARATNITPFANCHRGFKSLNSSSFLGNSSSFQSTLTSLRSRQSVAVTPRALLKIKENATGVEYPLVQKYWLGEEFRAMGAGVRTKKIAFLGVKVYAVALFVEAAKAAHEMGVRARGGFFETDDDYCSALVDGGFIKCLQIELVRDVEGATFVEALNEALTPRMSLTGETDATLDVVVRDQRPADWSNMVGDLSIGSPSLCRALFEVFLGEKSVIPDAKKEFANGARALLESDKVRRDTRKGGTG